MQKIEARNRMLYFALFSTLPQAPQPPASASAKATAQSTASSQAETRVSQENRTDKAVEADTATDQRPK